MQVELANPQARTGTHLYDSLGVLFRLVENGNAPQASWRRKTETAALLRAGLDLQSAARRLVPAGQATAHIDAVGLGNHALQRVLAHLLLSKEKRGRDRGFISYAELGINQLGAVYEGLMSYTGFFAETDLYEVAKGGDGSKGSWVVPTDRADGIAPADFVSRGRLMTGAAEARCCIRRGSICVPVGRSGTAAIRVPLHPRGAYSLHRRSGAGGTARSGRPHDDGR